VQIKFNSKLTSMLHHIEHKYVILIVFVTTYNTSISGGRPPNLTYNSTYLLSMQHHWVVSYDFIELSMTCFFILMTIPFPH